MLTAVCVRPADFDDAKIILWSDRMRAVCSEYPSDIALGAIDQWPKTEGGKFWPTENEFRALANFMGHFRRTLKYELEMALHAALPRDTPSKPDDGMSDDPSGSVLVFVSRWHGADPERCRIYLHGARFGESEIVVESMLSQMMIEKAMREHGCEGVTVKLKEYAR